MTTQGIDYGALAQALLARMGGGGREKAFPSSTPTDVYAYGPGGLFSPCGLRREVFNAMGLPARGLAARLPAQTSMEVNPLVALITGVDNSDGDEADGVCDDPPTAGLLRACVTTFTFGRLSRQSRVFDLDRFGKYNNRGEFRDLRFIGGLQDSGSPLAPTVPGNQGAAAAIRTELAKGMWELGVAFLRDFGRLTYSANPANNTAGGGYKEFKGLDLLINDGYVDVVDGETTCEAVDSVIADFEGDNITGNPDKTVSTIVSTWHELMIRASIMGLDPVKWVISMRPELFYELTAVWPCAYATSGCITPTGATLTISADEQIRMRDQMRVGNYLLIDGQQVEVITDPSILQTRPDAEDEPMTFESDIYFVPLTILGGMPVTFWEFVDYDAPGGAIEAAQVLSPNSMFQTSDGGRFLWHRKPANNFCVQVLAKTEPRLMLLTPHLAARITDVQYTTARVYRAAYPDEPGYANGGVTDRLDLL
jgi:hypothetical protein